MLTLADASSYFDRTQAYDAYSGEAAFLCQIDPFTESSRDAMAAYRRILSVAPAVALPGGNVITVFGVNWIVGAAQETDGLEQPYRVKRSLQQSRGLFGMGSLTQFLAGAPAASVHAFPDWVKDASSSTESSAVFNVYEVILPPGTACAAQQVLWNDDSAYLVQVVRSPPSGFVSANSLELDQSAPAVATLQPRVYAAAAGNYTPGDSVNVNALRVRWEDLFAYSGQLAPKFKEGDFVLALPTGTAVDTSTLITFSGASLQVLAVTVFGGGVAAHVRRA